MITAPSLFAESPAIPQPENHTTASDLNTDPNLVTGKLDNGLQYAILPNKEPPDRVSARLYINAGSLMETDSQQGLAHFLEHMAFNGTQNFPAGEMVSFFQRLGMAFGADTNAHTSFKETVYKLELPHADSESLDRALHLFHDYLGGMLLDQKEIDDERGIILSELLSRDSVGYRMMVEGYKFALPNALIAKRLPIGMADIIKTAPRQEFVDFYKKWYTPNRAWIIITGNINPKEIEAKIQAQFTKIPSTPTVADPDLGKINVGTGLRIKFQTENELPAVSISIDTSRPSTPTPDTAQKRIDNMVRSLGDLILNRRFDRLTKQENSPILSANVQSGDFLDFVFSAGAEAACQPDRWQNALETLEQEIRRAVEHGFTPAEIAEARALLTNQLESAARSADTRQSRDLADALVDNFANKTIFTTPAFNLQLYSTALNDQNTVNPNTVHAAFKKNWSTTDLNIFIGGKLDLPDPEKTIATAWQNSKTKPVTAPEIKENASFAYTDFGPAGKIVKTETIDDLGITQITFENHVVLNLKPTDFQKNQILCQVNIGGGRLDAKPGDEALLFYADNVFSLGGLEAHSSDDLTRIFAGESVDISFETTDDSFTLSGETEADDLQLQLQTLCAFTTNPGYRPEADRLMKSAIDSLYGQIDHSMEGVLRAKMPSLLRSGDKRFGFPERADLEKATQERLKAFLSPILAKGWMEINLVGDFKTEDAVAAVAATFGALPQREANKPAYTEERKITWPKDKPEFKLTYTTKVPKALMALTWPTADIWDINRTRNLNTIGDILDERLRVKIREQLGESYSPSAYHVASDTFTGFGVMTTLVIISPDQAKSVKKALGEIQSELLTKQITEDELKRVVEPHVTAIKQQLRDNSYWLNSVLRGSIQHPEKFDWSRTVLQNAQNTKISDLEPLIHEFLAKGREVYLNVEPLPFEEPAKTDATPAQKP